MILKWLNKNSKIKNIIFKKHKEKWKIKEWLKNYNQKWKSWKMIKNVINKIKNWKMFKKQSAIKSETFTKW